MNASPHWTVVHAEAGTVFLCEIAELIDAGVPSRKHIVPPPLIAKTYAASSSDQIYLPAPCVHGAMFHQRQGSDRIFFPFALPIPSLLIPIAKVSIRAIPEPPCVRWPAFTWPLSISLFAEFTKGSIGGHIAEASHTPEGTSS